MPNYDFLYLEFGSRKNKFCRSIFGPVVLRMLERLVLLLAQMFVITGIEHF